MEYRAQCHCVKHVSSGNKYTSFSYILCLDCSLLFARSLFKQGRVYKTCQTQSWEIQTLTFFFSDRAVTTQTLRRNYSNLGFVVDCRYVLQILLSVGYHSNVQTWARNYTDILDSAQSYLIANDLKYYISLSTFTKYILESFWMHILFETTYIPWLATDKIWVITLH